MGMVCRLKTKKGEWFGAEHGTGKSEEQNNFWFKVTEFKGLVPLDGTYYTQKTLLVRWPSLIGEPSTQNVMGMCNGLIFLAKGVRTIQAPTLS